jgi:RHS repeat-associated protein
MRQGRRFGATAEAGAGKGDISPNHREERGNPVGSDAAAGSRRGGSKGARQEGAGQARGAPQGVPELILPKGGGALRGIGETVSANPATGSASFSVPLPLPTGRQGMTPAISLTYGSGGGLGPFGMGWSIGVPRISRRTEKGLPRYGRGDVPDTFVLSGSEDLVPAREFDGQTWKADVRGEGDFTVTRFVPRQEGVFLRIEMWEGAAGDVHWKSIDKDNVASLYGTEAASRIVDPADSTRIFAWLLDEVRNDRGDLVRYRYKGEDDAGLPANAAERNRSAGEAKAQRYLKRIEYGLDAPLKPASTVAPAFHFEIVVDYGEHDPVAPDPADAGDWDYRADPSSDFRAGFEIRTRRLARRILVFHRFAELGPDPVLTRSLDFTYDHDPAGARLTRIVERGWDGAGQSTARPELSLSYSQASPDPTVRTLSDDSFDNLPQGIDGARFRFVDLYEEAAPGILVDEADAWFFKRNGGEGRLEAVELVAEKPNWARSGAGAELAQIEADGQLYATSRNAPAGYAARTDDGGWTPFRPFLEDAALDWSDPALRHADLDGDGRAEALLLRDEVICWFRNRGRAGYEAEARAFTGTDEEAGPACVLTNMLEGIFLADMTGDGLSDIVRIRNREICYWPNCGYGRFGAKVSMDGAPAFDHPDLFDPARLRLGDIDGSGTTDLIYLGRRQCLWWINRAGNSWSPGSPVTVGFPTLDRLTSVELVDLMAIGTSCLVWSSARPHDQPRPLLFADLMGGVKPYLLVAVDNGAGARTEIAYRSSGEYYRDDRRAGRPWRTRLPFPVHVVSRIVREDLISGGRLTSEYAYRHGYYDRAEREFRGFAMVEQRDVETVAAPAPHDLPPVVTRSWFHTGAWGAGSVSDGLAGEYFQNAPRLPDSIIDGAQSPRERREACRALRGQMLRQEVYALDGGAAQDRPYVVTETRCLVRRLQPCGPREGDHGVFAAWPAETLSQHLERDAGDPRIAHELVLDRDGYGNALRSFKVSYARAPSRRPAGTELAKVALAQSEILATLEEAGFVDDVAANDRHRHSVPLWTMQCEVTGLVRPGGIFTMAEARQALDALPILVPFGQQPAAAPAIRLFGASVHLYRTDASADADPDHNDVLSAAEKPFGLLDPLALPHRSYRLALTDDLLNQTIGANRLAAAGVDLAQEGYAARSFTIVRANGASAAIGGWWAHSPLESFDADGFYRPVRSQDAFGALWKIGYDSAWLAPVEIVDPLGSTVTATLDRRHMAPAEIIDPNGNRRLAGYDALGRLVAMAVAGKAGSSDGDSLAAPTEAFAYVEDEWSTAARPNHAHAKARETHGDPLSRWLETRVYSDGFGRELATKTRVRPGPAHHVDAGILKTRFADPRWIGSGRTIYDNKGNPVRRYEPYFSVTEDYEEEDALRLWGHSPEMRYDPLGRLIETRFPDLTSSRVRFDAWRQESWDRNDTLDAVAPWDKALTANPAGTKYQRARALALAHAGTPGIAHLDALGRTIMAEEDNKGLVTFTTRIVFDIEGRQLEVWDANRLPTLRQDFDMAGAVLRLRSNDAGESLALAAADGRPRHAWTPRGHHIRHDYDALRRPTATLVTGPAAVTTVSDRLVYGEAAPNAAAHNLIGALWIAFDGAGAMRTTEIDFKGNALVQERFAFVDPVTEADWSGLPADSGIQAWLAAEIAALTDPLAVPLFEPPFRAETGYDAHDRPVRERPPDGSEMRYGYDESGALRTVELLQLPGRAGATMAVKDIGYDAKGQRAWIEYGNGVAAFYSYDRTTDRLAEMLSTRAYAADADGLPAADALQPAPLQRLVYVHDPVGNIVEIEDLAQDKVFNEGMVAPRRLFQYDALYRLILATGREHKIQTGGGGQHQVPAALAQQSDMQNLRSYAQRYEYDAVGNITQMRHTAAGGNWTRDYVYDYQRALLGFVSPFTAASHPGDSNRLYSTTLTGGAPYQLYEHDAAGNILGLPSIAAIGWDHENRPEKMHIGTADADYRYDGGGERVRKLIDKGNVREERLYLGNYEIYRRWTGTTLDLRRDSLHVADDHRRVLLIETEKDPAGAVAAGQAPVLRYQLDDHLMSACLEADEAGQPISYEEFHPYGTTALHWKNSGLSQKRYRHSGMERDEESGLQYHSARYCLPWLGRWLSADPAGLADGPSLYQCTRSNPMNATDRSGTFTEPGPASINVGIKISGAFGTMHKKVGVVGSLFAAFPGRKVSGEVGMNVSLSRFSKMYNNKTGGGSFTNVQIFGMVGVGDNSNLLGSKSTGDGVSFFSTNSSKNSRFFGIGYALNINSFTGGMSELSNRTGGILLRGNVGATNVGFNMFNDVKFFPHFGGGTDFGITGKAGLSVTRGMGTNETASIGLTYVDITGIPDKRPGIRDYEDNPRFAEGNCEGMYRTIGLNKDLNFGIFGIEGSYSGPSGGVKASIYRYGGRQGAALQDLIHNCKAFGGYTSLFPYNMRDTKTGYDVETQGGPQDCDQF